MSSAKRIANTPAADHDVTPDLAATLIAEQFPQYRELEITYAASGWDNVVVRVGEHLAARLPRRDLAAGLVLNEHRWLNTLAPELPLPIPAPLHLGEPAHDYPYSWTIVPWFNGTTALGGAPLDLDIAADQLGGFLAALHQPAPPDAPRNQYRGVPLADREAITVAGIDQVGDLVDRTAVTDLWRRCRDAPRHDGPPVWVHGDLHPGNLLVADNALSAVIDFGDLCGGDPATDLAIGYSLIDEANRDRFFALAGNSDPTTRLRARGWALALGIAYLANSADDPHLHRLGQHTIAEVLAETS